MIDPESFAIENQYKSHLFAAHDALLAGNMIGHDYNMSASEAVLQNITA